MGSGRDIALWRDPWVPTITGFRPAAKDGVDIPPDITTVRDLMLEAGDRWNVGLIRSIFARNLLRLF